MPHKAWDTYTDSELVGDDYQQGAGVVNDIVKEQVGKLTVVGS